MSYDLLGAFVVFAIATLFTPGPNNVMLMASGLNFGFRRTVPTLLGVDLGFSAMVLIVGLGFGAIFAAYPAIYTVIKYVGAAYLLYLAWLIANSGPVEGGVRRGRPVSFLAAVGLQWVNPKGWVVAVGAVTSYAAVARFPFNILMIVSIFGVFGLASSLTWVMFGTALSRIVTEPRSVRIFNIVMALLLVASLIPVLVES